MLFFHQLHITHLITAAASPTHPSSRRRFQSSVHCLLRYVLRSCLVCSVFRIRIRQRRIRTLSAAATWISMYLSKDTTTMLARISQCNTISRTVTCLKQKIHNEQRTVTIQPQQQCRLLYLRRSTFNGSRLSRHSQILTCAKIPTPHVRHTIHLPSISPPINQGI